MTYLGDLICRVYPSVKVVLETIAAKIASVKRVLSLRFDRAIREMIASKL